MPKILIIEDDTYINNLIAKSLSREGYSCQQAFSGTEGLLYAKTEQFSLAILDLMLPGINGEELLPKLKNDFSTTANKSLYFTFVLDSIVRSSS